MSYKVSAADGYSLSLQEDSELISVLQNIALLLNTKRGTVPMHREFGLPMEFVDKPIDAAEAIAFVETGIPVFRYFVSIGGRQVDFVVCFFGAVRFGFIQTVVEFQTIVPEVFRLFIVGKVVELQVESYCVITSGSPLAQADLA